MKLGEFELFVVSDGTFRLDGGAMFGFPDRRSEDKTCGSHNTSSQYMIQWRTQNV